MAKILIVEDEPGIALGLKNDLVMEGYEVEVARDGQAGFDRAAHGAFDLILLDIMLPKKDGYTVCRELRQGGNRTPVLMLTAKALEAEKVLGLELGADDYVTKPFSSLELRARVRALLRRAAGDAPEVYRFAEVEVDFTRAEVRPVNSWFQCSRPSVIAAGGRVEPRSGSLRPKAQGFGGARRA